MDHQPPPAPPMADTLNIFRHTYMTLFNHILDTSININCICKTTTIQRGLPYTNSNKRFKLTNNKSVFDANNFLSDDDEDDAQQDNLAVNLGSAFAYSHEIGNFLRDADYDESAINKNMCDLTCFEKMRFVHVKLKESVMASNDYVKFELLWSTFKFLSKCPSSCDYYGTTIFHYAATDETHELLKRCLEKFPDGVKCVDSKGMTPLMRAVQRNNLDCVRYLLDNTVSDLNGSSQSTYTPLWFAVTNGYKDLALLLLNYNASSSMVEKSISAAIPLPTSIANTLLRTEDLSGGIAASRSGDPSSTSYLFSPLRASIVYSRFEIMAHLLEFNANVYELFNVGRVGCGERKFKLVRPGRDFNSKLNEDYFNSLKFFHRQFSPDEQTATNGSQTVDLDLQMNILNEFIDDVNVYRRMLIEFVKNLVHRLNSNLSLVDRLYDYLNSQSKANTIDYITKMNEIVSSEDGEVERTEWMDYLASVGQFIDSLEKFLSLTPENSFNFNLHTNNSLIRKPNYNQALFDFATQLVRKFHRPKSLKQLARFTIREVLFERVNSEIGVRYKQGFLKRDHLEAIVRQLGLPNGLANYLLLRGF